MQTIVLRSRDTQADPRLVDVLRRLFPECEIRVIPADNPVDARTSSSSDAEPFRTPSRSSRLS